MLPNYFLRSRLCLPHIVKFIGVSVQPTNLPIILSYINGFNLEDIIFENGEVPIVSSSASENFSRVAVDAF